MKVMVTGGTGFVGKALCLALIARGYDVRCAVRADPDPLLLDKENGNSFHKNNFVAVGAIGPSTHWAHSLQDIDTVIHLAARVHVMQDNTANPLAAYREVNTAGTERLAKEAAIAGVKRFVYLSTIKVNGENTGQRGEESKPRFSETDIPHHTDPYAVSKWEAEQVLHSIAEESGMEVVIVRPPLVYGPEVKANFLRLLQIVDRGIPLPLKSINNARSLVGLDNLVDFIITCVKHPSAAGETFLVSDGKELSTPELIRKIAHFMDKPCRLLQFPPNLLRFVGKLAGKKDIVNRLCDSLQLDISKAGNVLGWEPPVSVDEGLKKTVEWYMKKKPQTSINEKTL